ncbi:pyrimidine utilization protein A [Hypoxylon fragiforme]|uniref:pyrimidine utilization protein A n=1 Tax=Hypoxylon fragiforme TaxID=63214 RepID=UPI0020C5EDF3|nr:pyrimidine utilization protein A [Hypoxylon fragiforme]KAI2612932.1 pyrimidine utilization protein A [Hypoxylon fragiforme]
MASIEIGIFIPIGNNGWLISTTAPQYMPSFELNKQVVQKAESYGVDFALSMIKLRGFGGKTEFWDHNLESFTLMSALAAVTSKIKLYASAAILTLPPAIVARMATTVDSVAPGRFGINIVTGWQSAEYSQMGIWPGDAYFGYRYDYATEYVQVMRELWTGGVSNFKGKYFQMEDCKLSPRPKDDVKIIAAGQSGHGIDFASKHADFNFALGAGINTPTAYGQATSRLVGAAAKVGRDVGSYVLFMVIADETDEAAQAKWKLYNDGADEEALAWMKSESSKDTKADTHSTATRLGLREGAVNLNMGTLVGSYEKIARMLDEVALVPGTKGIMLAFDDFLEGVDNFGQKIQPLMKCRQQNST